MCVLCANVSHLVEISTFPEKMFAFLATVINNEPKLAINELAAIMLYKGILFDEFIYERFNETHETPITMQPIRETFRILFDANAII